MANQGLKRKILSALNCSASTHDSEHLCKDPIILSCGHYLCKDCLQTGVNLIKCNTCNEVNTRDLKTTVKTEIFNVLFEQNMNELFNVTLENFKNTFKTCNEIIFNCDDRIDMQIQLIKDNMLIRVESIKIELDNLYDLFAIELNEIEKKWKLQMKNIELNEKFDEKSFKEELEKLEMKIKKQENLNSENLYKYQEKIREMQKIILNYKDNSPVLEYKESEIEIQKNLVGELVFSIDGNIYKNIIKRIKENKFEQINTNYKVWDICELPNGNFVLTHTNNNYISLFDDGMKFIKSVSTIADGMCGIITDTHNKIFFCNYSNNSIIKTDLEFNQIASVGNGYGTAWNQFYYPYGICFYNNFIYVCDSSNNRIQRLNSNLIISASYPLGYSPWYIKNINNVALIRPNNEASVYFYDLNTFDTLKKYEGHNGMIGASKEYFYEYFPTNKTFYCYKRNGELIEQIQTNYVGMPTSNNYGSIYISKSKFFLTNFEKNGLIII